jgi:two-component system nitrogen regulation response regulator NtrX
MKVLVVDDEQAIRISLEEILAEEGYEVVSAQTAALALDRFHEGTDAVLLDIKLGTDNGIELLKKFKAQKPAIPVIIISGHGTVALTAEAFRLGAHEFLEKPLRLLQVRTCVRNALESIRLKRLVTEQEKERFPRPVYKSAVMQNLYQQAVRLASMKEPVVIFGPTGSGKELVARTLHYDGARSAGPFIATNAASLPVSLAEDELFGHEKGAYTGAQSQRIGCIEKANGGTLLLDEIADLDIQIQPKLLRVLETGQFMRLGGSRQISVHVRIVAATHKNLQQLVEQGTFRHDLWYRICAFVLHVPALHERPEDIPMLANLFLQKTGAEIGAVKEFSPKALELLTGREYPGNVRELKHIVTRAAVFSADRIIDETVISLATSGLLSSGNNPPAAWPKNLRDYSAVDFKTAHRMFEHDYFSSVLATHNNNITSTAAAIGMAQSNLSRKLKELGLRG